MAELKIHAQFLIMATAAILASCAQSPVQTDRAPASETTDSAPHACLALRGNGPRIFATMEGIASLTEKFGVMNAVAGASSGSVATFLYESILLNPAIWQCGQAPCSPEAASHRVALAVRSFQGYVDLLQQDPSSEWRAFTQLPEALKKLEHLDLDGANLVGTAGSVVDLISSTIDQSLLNPEIKAEFKKAASFNHPVKRLQRLKRAGGIIGKWTPGIEEVIYRPGLLDIAEVTRLLGKIGNFYADRTDESDALAADQNRWNEFLGACSEKASGKIWSEIARAPAASPSCPSCTCQELFSRALTNYRSRYPDITSPAHPRIQDPIGKGARNWHAFASVSVLTAAPGDDLVSRYRANLQTYLNNFSVADMKIKFNQFKIGYWGRSADLSKVESAFHESPGGDAKIERFMSLGEVTWQSAIQASIAEPGLAHMQPYPPMTAGDSIGARADKLTFGGWTDAHPTQALQALGCQNIFYVNRQGTEADLPITISRIFGASPEDLDALYSARSSETTGSETPDSDHLSSYQLALKAASGVYCTDWNHVPQMDREALVQDAHKAKLVTSRPDLLSQWPERASSKKILGCSFDAPAAQ